MIGVAIGLEQTPDECRIGVVIVAVQHRVGHVGRPPLAGVTDERGELREAAGVPPDREGHRVKRQLRVADTRQCMCFDSEQRATKLGQALQDIIVPVGDA